MGAVLTSVSGTNKFDAEETVNVLAEDLEKGSLAAAGKEGGPALARLLVGKGLRWADAAAVRRMEAEELRLGRESGRVRVKLTNFDSYLGQPAV